MPLIRCPDCLRDIEVSVQDLTCVIECRACAARFGPVVKATAALQSLHKAEQRARADEERAAAAAAAQAAAVSGDVVPRVHCPDCLRDITLSLDDLTRVIECSACGARFGPLVAPPPALAAPPPRDDARDEPDDDTGAGPLAVPYHFSPRPVTTSQPVVLAFAAGVIGLMLFVLALAVLGRGRAFRRTPPPGRQAPAAVRPVDDAPAARPGR